MADKTDKFKMVAIRLRLEEMKSNIDVGAMSYENDGSINQKNGNGQEKKIVDYISKRDALQKEYTDLMLKISEQEKWKEELIDKLDDSRLYAIASMLFISYMPQEKIAEIMEYDDRKTVQRKKIKILEILENVLECPID